MYRQTGQLTQMVEVRWTWVSSPTEVQVVGKPEHLITELHTYTDYTRVSQSVRSYTYHPKVSIPMVAAQGTPHHETAHTHTIHMSVSLYTHTCTVLKSQFLRWRHREHLITKLHTHILYTRQSVYTLIHVPS